MAYDVVIAGGGPVGLFLAGELQLAGVSVVVLERMEDFRSPLKEGWMGGRGLNFPSVQSFYRRGLLDAVRSSALGWMNAGERPGMDIGNQKNGGGTPPPRFAGHFAGMMLDVSKIDFSNQKYVLPGPSASGGMVSLEGLERELEERAVELGVDVRRGVAVTNFTEDEKGVVVFAGEERFEGKWLVGCDGGRSTVRKLAEFEFVGTDPEFMGYTASVELADPEKLRPGFNLTDRGMYVVTGPTRVGMIDFDDVDLDRTREITPEEFQAILRRISGTDVTVKTLHVVSTYTDRALQATTYRKGRVLLAGDAAHIHSPLGGQGLNTGIGDAMNLGWKLAATIQGWAPEGLLDSYTEERHPAGAWALEWTRAQVAIMKPNPHARAIASVIRDLIQTQDGTRYFAEKVSGIGAHYDLGGGHPLIGRSVPDFEFEDGTRAGELLHDGRGVLVDFAGSDSLRAVGERWKKRLKYVGARAKDEQGLGAVLIRPDGFVGWAAEAGSEVEIGAVERAAERWFGAARC